MSRTATGFDRDALKRLSGAVQHHEHARKFSAEDRERAVRDGAAMPGGSHLIYNQADLDSTLADYDRMGQPAAVKAHIVARAKELGLKTPFDDD